MALQQVHGGIVDGRDTFKRIHEKDKGQIMALAGELVVWIAIVWYQMWWAEVTAVRFR
jgi:hypothetical protein